MRMILPVTIRAPNVRPDLGGPQHLLAGAQNDSQGFVVEYERQAGHENVVRCPFTVLRRQGVCHGLPYANVFTDNGLRKTAWGGRGVSAQSDTFARVSA